MYLRRKLENIRENSIEKRNIQIYEWRTDTMYLPLAYVDRYSVLTDLYCGKERCDCEPEILLDMISDEKWGTEEYSGPNKEKYIFTYNMMDNNYFIMHAISACFAVAGFSGIWKYNKVVYEPDYDFSKELLCTNRLRVYPELIKHIPFNTFYLDFSKNDLFEYAGFFVQVKVYETGAIRIVTLPTEYNFSDIPIDEDKLNPTAYADVFWINPEKFSVENGMCYFDFDLYKDLIWTVDSYKTQWFIGGVSNYRLFLLQFLMYLSSKEPDIIESPDTISTYRPSSVLKNKYSEVQKWDIGCRYGEKIRCFNKNKMLQFKSNEYNNQNSKRPHIRKAHWERYHIGKGRKEVVTKWKEPVFINGDYNDITANIHIVTNKEAEGSSGEECIKQFLKTRNISFRKEHYIREIRKRYDFSFKWNDVLVFIEFDGEQHFKSINRWKGKKGYMERRKADMEKNEYCRNNNIPLLRIRFDQVYLIPDMINDFLENTGKYYQKYNTYLTNDMYYSICE